MKCSALKYFIFLQSTSTGLDNHVGEIALLDDIGFVRIEHGEWREARWCTAGSQMRSGFLWYPVSGQ